MQLIEKHRLYERLYLFLLPKLPEEFKLLDGLNTFTFKPIHIYLFEIFECPLCIAENPFYFENYILHFDERQAELFNKNGMNEIQELEYIKNLLPKDNKQEIKISLKNDKIIKADNSLQYKLKFE